MYAFLSSARTTALMCIQPSKDKFKNVLLDKRHLNVKARKAKAGGHAGSGTFATNY
jgi:hypothetical protein